MPLRMSGFAEHIPEPEGMENFFHQVPTWRVGARARDDRLLCARGWTEVTGKVMQSGRSSVRAQLSSISL